MKGLWALLVLSVLSFLPMVLIGNHGGKIRRPELRGEKVELRTNPTQTNNQLED